MGIRSRGVGDNIVFFLLFYMNVFPSVLVTTFCYFYTKTRETRYPLKMRNIIKVGIVFSGILTVVLIISLGMVVVLPWVILIELYSIASKFLLSFVGSFIVMTIVVFMVLGSILLNKHFIQRFFYWFLKIIGSKPQKEYYPLPIDNTRLLGLLLASIVILHISNLNNYMLTFLPDVLQSLQPNNDSAIIYSKSNWVFAVFFNTCLFVFCNYFFRFVRKRLEH